MGDEIAQRHFEADDFSRFRQLLNEETDHIARLFAKDGFSIRGDVVGFELEAWIVDNQGQPLPINQELISSLDNPLVVPELSQFNVELNGSPSALTGKVFSRMLDELQATWRFCQQAAEAKDCNLVQIGILPTIRPDLLNANYMTDMLRYRAMNDRVISLRDGKPLPIDINGREALQLLHDDVMLEAATTSFQIHLQCKPDKAVRDFNAALVASAPMVAISANAPYLFGRNLWAETRIPLFEQAVNIGERHKSRVNFGTGYIKQSLLEIFEENKDQHSIMLPFVQAEPLHKYAHLRFQNGTIWRWNRPLIGFDYDGQPHLRIEHRTVPAGPTIRDCVANCAMFVGALRGLVDGKEPIEDQISFEDARLNFYEAARYGLDASITWVDGKLMTVRELVLEELLPAAHDAFLDCNLPQEEIDEHLGIIEGRVISGQNGSVWQRKWIDKNGPDFPALTLAYLERQESDIPVHKWELV